MPKSSIKSKRNIHKTPKGKKAQNKIGKVMREFYHHKLHSGSKQGPIVTNVAQAQAIAISEAKHMKHK